MKKDVESKLKRYKELQIELVGADDGRRSEILAELADLDVEFERIRSSREMQTR